MSTLNDRIKQRRIALNYTLLYIAEQLGVKEATVQRYESGDIKNIKHDTIVQLAEILKCSPSYLMGWEDIVPANDDSTNLNYIEKHIIAAYRKADDTDKELVHRILKIDDALEKGAEKKLG